MLQDWFSLLNCEVRKREDDPYQMTQQGGPIHMLTQSESYILSKSVGGGGGGKKKKKEFVGGKKKKNIYKKVKFKECP